MKPVSRDDALMSYAQQVENHFAKRPDIPASAFVAPGATVVGDVTLGEEASIWFGVGAATNSGVTGLDNWHWAKQHGKTGTTPKTT